MSPNRGSAEEGWWFWAGDQRLSVPFRFLVGPRGEFALEGAIRTVLLYASVDGWVESVALSYRASAFAGQITNVRGTAVQDLDRWPGGQRQSRRASAQSPQDWGAMPCPMGSCPRGTWTLASVICEHVKPSDPRDT
jgi:hypothetical protein